MQDGPEWDYWPCACTRTYRGRRQFKQLHRSVRQCPKCLCQRPAFISPTRPAANDRVQTEPAG